MSNPLKSYREAKGHGALAALSRRTGIAKSTLTEIAKGLREPTLEQARRLNDESDGEIAFALWLDSPAREASQPERAA